MSGEMTTDTGRVYALTIHRDYRCAHSGLCCTSGSEIPVERETARALDDARRSCRLSLDRMARSAGDSGVRVSVDGRGLVRPLPESPSTGTSPALGAGPCASSP